MADYGKDLAYIHDAGFLQLAEQAGPLVVEACSPTAGSSAGTSSSSARARARPRRR